MSVNSIRIKQIKGDVKNQPYEDTEKIWSPDGFRTHDPPCSKSNSIRLNLFPYETWQQARVIKGTV